MNKITLILFFCLLIINCGNKKEQPKPELNSNKENNDSSEITIQDPYINLSSNQFYELEKSMESILNEINELKVKIKQYEHNPKTLNYTEELKQLIDKSPPKHKIVLHNGTIIQGTIINDLINSIMIVTDLGKLNINKNEIDLIEDMILPVPNIVFVGNGQEEKFEDHYIFSGRILNQGQRRGDFVRIIYQLWSENTQMINSDSIFIDGKEILYQSGIITDTALEPNQSTYFTLQVNNPNKIAVSYITRDIQWEIYK